MRYIICKEYKAKRYRYIVQPYEGHHFARHFCHHFFELSLACLIPELQVELHEGDGADGVHGVDVEGLRNSAINLSLKVESDLRKHEAIL